MAIRGPGGPPRPEPATTSPIREQATSPLQRLVDFGMARTPAEASKVLREIIALLAGAGFPVPKLGSPEQQLQTALKAFQQKEGLPVTGKLDEATKGALEQAGLLPAGRDSVVDSSAGRPSAKDGVDGAPRPGFDFGVPRFGGGGGDGAPTSGVPAQKGRAVETEAAAARVEHGRPDVEVDLRAMLGALREAGFAGAGKGKEQLTDAVKKLQRVDGLPVTGKLDAATATALEKRGVLDAATAQVLREQDPTWAPPSSSSTASSSTATTPSSSDPSASTTNAEARGAGSGEVAGTAGGRGSEGGAGVGGEAGATGTTSHGDVDGQSDDIGNGYAGDLDDDDARRGRANRDADDADDAFGHWEVPRLARQVDAAFDGIVRDDDGHGPATYGWRVVLHRPGVYAARQPAEEVLKLVVTRAGPFDPVWQQALDALNARLGLFDPEAPAVDPARLRLALQKARYR
jgi:hypothetical protein